MKGLLVHLLLLIAVIVAVNGQEGPEISTENGNLRVASPGDVVFQAGEGGQIMFMSASGENMAVGEKGEKGDVGDTGAIGMPGFNGLLGPQGNDGPIGQKGERGDTGMDGSDGQDGIEGTDGTVGPPGQQGLRGVSATDSSLVTWNECVWENLNAGQDYGQIATCRLNKAKNDTWLRISWSGNMRITRCATCCMRWYFTVNGEECADPGPIDAVLFQSQNYHLLRHSTITGSCRATDSNGEVAFIPAGPVRVQFSLMECPGFGGFVYDSYTGFNSVSRITIDEIIPRDTTYPELAVVPPSDFIYTPNYCQYFFPHLGFNRERNVGMIATVKFMKLHEHTVLSLTWEGNLRKKSCSNCCTRWWIEVDGSPCSAYEEIETSIRSSTAQDISAPTTISGLCFESGDLPLASGSRQIRLMVGNCPGSFISNAGIGFFSTSRLIVDEIPRPRNPLVNPDYYHPQWEHCVIQPIDVSGLTEGPLETTSCTLNKTTDTSSVRVTFNGNIHLSACTDCCMRWFVTLNGQECTSPASIEAIVAAVDVTTFNIHRGSTITGICDMTADGPIMDGPVEARLNVGPCNGSNETFRIVTGEESISSFTVEELPQPVDTPLPDNGYNPTWTHCTSEDYLNAYRNSSDNSTESNPPIQTCPFTKRENETALRVAWDGNIAVLDCIDCCMRWFLTVNGEECSDPGPIDAALVQDLTEIRFPPNYDLFRPASIVGICRGYGGSNLSPGDYTVELMVGPCVAAEGDATAVPVPADTMTGYNSVSRIIIEEIPDSPSFCERAIVTPSF